MEKQARGGDTSKAFSELLSSGPDYLRADDVKENSAVLEATNKNKEDEKKKPHEKSGACGEDPHRREKRLADDPTALRAWVVRAHVRASARAIGPSRGVQMLSAARNIHD